MQIALSDAIDRGAYIASPITVAIKSSSRFATIPIPTHASGLQQANRLTSASLPNNTFSDLASLESLWLVRLRPGHMRR